MTIIRGIKIYVPKPNLCYNDARIKKKARMLTGTLAFFFYRG